MEAIGKLDSFLIERFSFIFGVVVMNGLVLQLWLAGILCIDQAASNS